MHNYLTDRLNSTDNKTVDHINRIGTDNRKENLRIISPSAQLVNQNKIKRKAKLPENSGIKIDDLPRCVWYCKDNKKKKGDGFCVDIKGISKLKNITWYSSKDSTLSLRFKLEQTKKYIRYIINTYKKELEPYSIEKNYTIQGLELLKSYNEILKLSNYDCVNKNIIKIDEKNYLIENLNGLTTQEKGLLKNYDPKTEEKHKNKLKLEGRRQRNRVSKLPNDCGVTKEMIPKYCYYKPLYVNKNRTRGDAFVIDKKNPNVTKQWSTSSSKEYTTLQKFQLLLNKLKEIE